MSLLRRLLLVLAVVAVIGGAVFWLLTIPATVPANALPARAPDLANGEVMFLAGGCAGCHAPDVNAPTRLGGGVELRSPFGTFHAPNISPDPADGIGRWTEAQFVSAVLKGTSPDGRHYYPSFPYTSYQRMRVEDVRDLFAYLKTLPAVQGRSRPHELPFPFNVRRAVGLWKTLFLDGQAFREDPGKSPVWNRGAYLVNALAHCAECHSPRNLLGAIIEGQRFAGGPNPTGQGFVPNITQAKLGDWSEEDFVTLLETGQTPSFDSVSGSMDKVVKGTARLPASDRAAMAAYLKALPAVNSQR